MTDQKHIDLFMVGFEAGAWSTMLALGFDHDTVSACVNMMLEKTQEDPLMMTTVVDAVEATLDGRPFESSLKFLGE